MLDRLFGPRTRVSVLVTGIADGRMVRHRCVLSLRGEVTVQRVLQAAGRSAGVDLLAALVRGEQPVVLLGGRRLELPDQLGDGVADGAELSWLLPMAGG